MTSPDGITWTARVTEVNYWYGVTYGNGLFVAVSSSGTNRVMTSGGTFLTLDGSATQTLSGTMTGANAFGTVVIKNNSAPIIFANEVAISGTLTASTSRAELQLKESATSTVNNLVLKGTAGGEVLLRSAASGTRADLLVQGTYDVQYAKIKDSNGSSTRGVLNVVNANNIDQGNNTGWRFMVGPNEGLFISGTLYESNRTTPYATSSTITVALVATTTLATFSTTTTPTTGTFTISADLGTLVATSTPVTLFVNNAGSDQGGYSDRDKRYNDHHRL